MTHEMPSEAAIQKCRELGIDEKWAHALDDMWNEMDAEIIRWLGDRIGYDAPRMPPDAPYDGSMKRRRYWKKVQFADGS